MRTVKVELEAGVAKYVPPVDEAAHATERLDDKVKETNRDLDKVPASTARAAASMKLLGAEADATKLKLNDTGHGASTALEQLDQKLVAARADMRKFADEFNRTGDSSALGKFNRAKQDVEDLEKLGKDLTGALRVSVRDGISTGGKEGAKNASAALQGILSTSYIGPIIAAAIVAGVVAALPLINGALTAAGGLGLIGAGIAAQFQSQQVKDAGAGLIATLKSGFLDATSSFRAPVESALLDLTNFSRELDLRSVFQPLAQFIGPLEKGLQGFLSRLVGGLGKFSENIKPLMDVFIMHLPQLGAVLSSFLQRISRNAGENASALDALLTILESSVRVVGQLIEAFDHVYKVAVNVALGIAIAFDKAFGWVPLVGKQLDQNVLTLGRLAAEADGGTGALDNTATAADGLNGAIGPNGLGKSVISTAQGFQQLDTATLKWKNDALDAKNASLEFKDALANLKDQLKQNGAGFNENTADGRKNVEALNQLAQSAQDVADKTYASTGNSQAAAQAYKQARDQVLALAKQGHASADEINALNQALDNAIKIRKGSVEIEVNLTGSGKALVNNQGTVTLGGKGIKLRAAGGGLDPGDTAIVGENGPELLQMRPGGGGWVTPNSHLPAVLGGMAGGFAPIAPVVNVIVSPKDGALGALVDLIDVRVEHGNTATANAVSAGPRL